MDNKIKVLTKDQTILTIPTCMAVRFGKIKRMLEKHEGSLVSTTFDMQLISSKALEALIKCFEKRDAFLKTQGTQADLPAELCGPHGSCVKVNTETLMDILDTYDEIDLNCQLNVSQNAEGACIDLEYDSYFSHESQRT